MQDDVPDDDDVVDLSAFAKKPKKSSKGIESKQKGTESKGRKIGGRRK